MKDQTYPDRRQFRARLIDPCAVAPMAVVLASDDERMAAPNRQPPEIGQQS